MCNWFRFGRRNKCFFVALVWLWCGLFLWRSAALKEKVNRIAVTRWLFCWGGSQSFGSALDYRRKIGFIVVFLFQIHGAIFIGFWFVNGPWLKAVSYVDLVCGTFGSVTIWLRSWLCTAQHMFYYCCWYLHKVWTNIVLRIAFAAKNITDYQLCDASHFWSRQLFTPMFVWVWKSMCLCQVDQIIFCLL